MPRAVSYEEGEAYAKKNGLLFYETSALGMRRHLWMLVIIQILPT